MSEATTKNAEIVEQEQTEVKAFSFRELETRYLW